MIRSIRALLVLSTLALVTVVMIPFQWIALRAGWDLRRRLPVLWHRIACRLVGIRIIEHGKPSAARPLLIAANHSSWLDITVLGSRMPLSFIAKSEVAGWPVFGLFAKLQRSVFVDRERRADTGRIAAEIGTRMVDGDAMVLFAEGTSNDGNGVLPFRSALLGAARHALAGEKSEVLVQPLSIAYTRLQGLPMGRQFRPRVAWYGDMEMAGHFLAVVKEGAIDVELGWGKPIPFRLDTDRKALARRLESEVRAMTVAALTGSSRRAEGPPADPLFSSGEKPVKAPA